MIAKNLVQEVGPQYGVVGKESVNTPATRSRTRICNPTRAPPPSENTVADAVWPLLVACLGLEYPSARSTHGKNSNCPIL